MEFLHRLLADDIRHALGNFKLGAPYGAPSLACTLLFMWVIFAYRRHQRGRRADFYKFIRAMFPQRILLHKSTRMDLRLWIVNAVVIAAAYSYLAVGVVFCRDLALGGLNHLFGAYPPIAWQAWAVIALATTLELLAYELAYWFGHYLFHRFAFLWEFHKVHHSAEVMTSLTELRQHPVEILTFVNLIAIATGATFGALTYAFGPGAHAFTLLNVNIALLLFMMSWGHLRHTHIWLAFTGLAGRIFQSPAHHQLHHSDNPLHFNKNLGFSLAVWDWLFGTLVIPDPAREKIRFGVGETRGDYDTVLGALAKPFVRSAEHLAPAAVAETPAADAP